ncbi:hypothetical protein [Dyadobacter luticola]|uniref:RES domain-containing protein n=1 Tax=Dyadobacter luticola TaxID=1979387 RepID=A0A5R9KVT5_9BACT|nr:hypothetical protein [Dyadobacter luticola]TLV00354.1 hypothetical protein FEN17_12725 [Dyadobacter luticola]
MHPTLNFLSQIMYNLAYVDYEMIYQSIENLDHKIIPTSLLHKGHFIERARINYGGEIFTRPDQVSYISDPEVLRDRVKFGRANVPEQGVFYGSIVSPEIEMPRAVAYFETSSRIEELKLPGQFEEIFTVSRWEILETVQLAEIIYADQYSGTSKYVQMSIQNQRAHVEEAIEQLKLREDVDYTEHFALQSKIICNEFAKTEIDSPDDYKISAAYANYILNRTPAQGLTYPSVKSGYKGQNVVMLPNVVDKILSLKEVYMCFCRRQHSENPLVAITHIVTNVGSGEPFTWASA